MRGRLLNLQRRGRLSSQRGFSLLELLVVLIIISFLVFSGMDVYLKKIEDSKVKSVNFQAGVFSRMVQNIHAYSISTGKQAVDILERRIYVNEYGYPANISNPSFAHSYSQTAEECREVWSVFFQTLSSYNKGENSGGMLVKVSEKGVCRYDFYPEQENTYYFDYYLKTGQVSVGQNQ